MSSDNQNPTTTRRSASTNVPLVPDGNQPPTPTTQVPDQDNSQPPLTSRTSQSDIASAVYDSARPGRTSRELGSEVAVPVNVVYQPPTTTRRTGAVNRNVEVPQNTPPDEFNGSRSASGGTRQPTGRASGSRKVDPVNSPDGPADQRRVRTVPTETEAGDEALPDAAHLPSLEGIVGGGIDLEQILREQAVYTRRSAVEKVRGFLDGASEWAGLGSSLISKPINFLFDGNEQPQSSQEVVYMSRLKKQMYNLGAALIWMFSAIITQGVCSHIFPFIDQALAQTKDSFFKDGFFTVSVKAIIASLVFTFMLSVIETMLYDPHKSRAKKLLVFTAFVVDIAINAIGWSDFFQHSRHFEWVPFAPCFKGQEFEWGSFISEFAALLNAALPEIMWHKARHARTAQKQLAAALPNQAIAGGQEQHGIWVRNPKGQAQWVSEAQLRQLRKLQADGQSAGGQRANKRAAGGR